MSTAIIARREFRSYFDSPVAYVVSGVSLLVVGIIVFREFWTVNHATLGQLFQWLPWALTLLIIPSLTMRLLAEERRTGTIELLITMPVRDRDVIFGKFLATLGLCAVLFLLTTPYIYFIGKLGDLDYGPIWVGYLGLLLFAAAEIAIGLYFSSITENQTVAFMLTWLTLLAFFFLAEYVGTASSGLLGDIFSFVSFQRRVNPFSRGLIDLRNVVFFLSVTAFFLILTVRSLESRKWK